MKFYIFLIVLLYSCSTFSSKKEALKSKDPALVNDYGVKLLDQKKYKQAIPYFQRAIHLANKTNFSNQQLGYTHYNYALSLRKLQKNQEAIREYRKSISIYPQNRYAYVNLGHILASSGDDIAAIKVYEQGLQRFPDELYMNENLALSYIRMGQHKKAIPLLSKAIVYRNNHPELKNNEIWRERWIEYLSKEHIDRQ